MFSLRELSALVLPEACARCGCKTQGTALCPSCSLALPRLPAHVCACCQAARDRRPRSERCTPCEGRRSALRACIAAAPYEGEVRAWVQRFKYPDSGLGGLDPGPAAVLRKLVCEAAARAPERGDVVVPVPLHTRRLRRRGFNPAGLLARSVARTERLPLSPTALERVRDTPSQAGLDRPARLANVRDAFRARRALPGRVWLVDDVVTTGATLEAAARALRRAGAGSVVALCAARTPLVPGGESDVSA